MKLLSALIVLLAVGVSACGDSPTSPTGSAPFSTVDVTVGTGAEATAGRLATVNYILYLYSASAAENKGQRADFGTFSFTIGSNDVIAGFSQATQGMRVGGIRRAVVPPELGYGSQRNDPIPPNSTLVFEIELLAIQ
jgi:FKBP-type peptidyl-prolyl cis-trans isomerase FkpA